MLFGYMNWSLVNWFMVFRYIDWSMVDFFVVYRLVVNRLVVNRFVVDRFIMNLFEIDSLMVDWFVVDGFMVYDILMMRYFMMIFMINFMVSLLNMNRHREGWHIVTLLPKMIIIVMFWFMVGMEVLMIMSFNKLDSLVMRRGWLKVFMEEMELGLFTLSHLVCIVVLTFHSLPECFVVWSVTNMWTGDPILRVLINLSAMGSGVQIIMDGRVKGIEW